MAGRPKYKPSDEHRHQVKVMAAFGIQQSEIATLIECNAKTLRKYYRRELDTGAIEANVRVAQSIFNMATKGENITAAIWWTKARMGWRGTTNEDPSPPDQPHTICYDFRWADAKESTTLPAPSSHGLSDPPRFTTMIDGKAVTTTIDGNAVAAEGNGRDTADAEDSESGGIVVTWAGESET